MIIYQQGQSKVYPLFLAALLLIFGAAASSHAPTGHFVASAGAHRTADYWLGRSLQACGSQSFARCGGNAWLAGHMVAFASNSLGGSDESAVGAYPKVGDVQAVVSGVSVNPLLRSKSVPISAVPDVVGAFRFLCGPGQLSYDDPIVYPGRPGKAHLHQFFGNLSAGAHSTYNSLRQHGDSTCLNELNRSAYWMPAMLNGKGNVVRPDIVSIYYKRRPSSDPFCQRAGKGCVGIPRGLRMVFGWDQARPTEPQPENSATFHFKCSQGGSPTTPAYFDMVEVMKVCKPGQRLNAVIHTPQCWNGVDLDTADHRSHLANMKRDRNSGQLYCPGSHPWIIPEFTMGVMYSIEIGDDPSLWFLSSDHMLPQKLRRPGASFHSDYFEGWEDSVRIRWEKGCLDHLLNCSDGDLGDGQIMVPGRRYPSGKARPRLVDVP